MSETNDPLLSCLEFLTAHYGRAKSGPALVSGLAYDAADMGPHLFCEAAERVGLRTKVVKLGQIKNITAAVLPVVVILKEKQACVLLKMDTAKNKALIWTPQGHAERTITLSDLKADYSGYVIYVHPRPEFNDADAPGSEDADRHWLWGPTWDARGIYGRVIIASILINLFALTGPVFIMNIYDRVIPNAAVETGWALGIGALAVFVFDFIIRTLRGYFIDLAGKRIDILGARKIYDQLLNIKLAHRPASSGAFANMLRDFDSVRDFFTSATIATLVDLPFTVLFLIVIWIIGGDVAVILASLIVITIAIGVMLQAPLKSYVRKATKSSEAKHGLLVETIHGLETIKAIGADGRLRARYGQYLAENAQYGQGSRFVSALGVNTATFFSQSATILVVLTGMYMVQDQTLSVGALIACVMLGGRAIAPIGQLANLMSRYHGAKSALKTLNGIMEKPVDRPARQQFLHRPDLSGAVSLQKVSFMYPNSNRKVLDQVSISIKAGEKVGIIGRIGSGKSTLARLMMGLYEPAEGTVLYDDTDYRQIDPADLRRNIAYIAQDVVLLSGTVRDNITASAPHAREEDVLAASQAAGVHEFIARHPMGYDAPVGERGEGLSGGQRQCVALARAMLLGPKIFICDEPTNAMDVQAEGAFTRLIAEQSKDKTLVLITHRQHLLSLVDRVILVDQGKVLMDGARDKVMAAISGGIAVKEGSA